MDTFYDKSQKSRMEQLVYNVHVHCITDFSALIMDSVNFATLTVF